MLSSRMFTSSLVSFWDTFPFVQCVLFGSSSICQTSPGIRNTVYVHTAGSEISSGFFFFNYLFFSPSTPDQCLRNSRRTLLSCMEQRNRPHGKWRCWSLNIAWMKEKVKTFVSDPLECGVWFGSVSFRTAFLAQIVHDILHVSLKCLHTFSASVVNK